MRICMCCNELFLLIKKLMYDDKIGDKIMYFVIAILIDIPTKWSGAMIQSFQQSSLRCCVQYSWNNVKVSKSDIVQDL